MGDRTGSLDAQAENESLFQCEYSVLLEEAGADSDLIRRVWLSRTLLKRGNQTMTARSRVMKTGIIGCGDITQVAHIPIHNFLSDLFTITYLRDVSVDSLKHNAQKVINHILKTTQDPTELYALSDVELVFIANWRSDEYHAVHVIDGQKYDKHVFIEKPMALCLRDADAIIEAETRSKGKVMVGFMRLYAAAFLTL